MDTPQEPNQENRQLQIQEPLVLQVTDEEEKKLEEIANHLFTIIGEIKDPFTIIQGLIKNKVTINHKTYFELNEEEDVEFFQNITKLNESLGKASSILDSYIRFTKSSPDFDKFLNIIYNFVVNYNAHRGTIFFQANAEMGLYLYPYFEVDAVMKKMNLLYHRLCGTLRIGGQYIIIQPPRVPSSMGEFGIDRFERPGYFEPYSPYHYEQPKPKTRDIGDAYDR